MERGQNQARDEAAEATPSEAWPWSEAYYLPGCVERSEIWEARYRAEGTP